MAVVFTEQQEQLPDRKMKSEWSIVNRSFISYLYFNMTAMLIALLCGCTNRQTDKHLQKEMRLYNEASIQLQNENGIYTNDHQPFTGTVFSLSPTKKDTLSIGSFVEGKEDGEWRKYFTNGQLMEKRFYSTGKKVGTYTAWWPNGKQRLLYHFAAGEYEGACQDWAEDGTLISEMSYHEGHEEGPQKQWYENGKIKANYIIKDGRRYGLLGTKNCVNVSDSVFKKG